MGNLAQAIRDGGSPVETVTKAKKAMLSPHLQLLVFTIQGAEHDRMLFKEEVKKAMANIPPWLNSRGKPVELHVYAGEKGTTFPRDPNDIYVVPIGMEQWYIGANQWFALYAYMDKLAKALSELRPPNVLAVKAKVSFMLMTAPHGASEAGKAFIANGKIS